MCADDIDEPAAPDPSDTSEHATRNGTQLKLLKLAAERKRHGAYIDAMLERWAPGAPETTPGRTDADKKDPGPDS